MHILDGNVFKDLQLSVSCENHDQIIDVIARLYQENGQTRMARTENAYQRINLAVLRFLNTTGCWQRMILACFICKMAFDDKLKRDNYYDNYMYNNMEARQVPKFDGYNIMARLSMMYKYTIKYSNLLLSSKCDRLLTANPIKNPRIAVE